MIIVYKLNKDAQEYPKDANNIHGKKKGFLIYF